MSDQEPVGNAGHERQGAPRQGVVRSLRRRPTQSRGHDRVAEILDATESLLHRFQPEDLTTTMIAKKAGINAGSLYHFFADKFAIYTCLIERVLKEIDKSFQLDDREVSSFTAFIDEVQRRMRAVWANRQPLVLL